MGPVNHGKSCVFYIAYYFLIILIARLKSTVTSVILNVSFVSEKKQVTKTTANSIGSKGEPYGMSHLVRLYEPVVVDFNSATHLLCSRTHV